MPLALLKPEPVDASAAQRAKARVRLHSAALLAVCLLLSTLRWCKMEGLWGDASRWIFEVYRASTGELPYREFAWQYPPLAIFLFGGALRVFGQTFATLQVLLDLIGAGIVLLTWDLARRILPAGVAWLAAFALACAGASNTNNFALFSLEIYTPAMLLGMAGMLIVLRESIRYFQTGRWSRTMLYAGAAIAILSKPEFAVGAVGCLIALALSDRTVPWPAVFFGALAPSAAVYAALAVICGPANLLEGVAGYGQASLACPWWPTGIGVFGGLTALGQAAIVAAALALAQPKSWNPHRRLLFAAALAGILLTILYLPFCAAEIPVLQGHITALRAAGFFLSTGTILLPVMWVSLVLWVVLAMRLARARRADRTIAAGDAVLFVTITAGAMMSLRGLFGGPMNQLTLANTASYPIWFLVGSCYLMRLAHGRARTAVTAMIAVFGLIRFAGVAGGEWRGRYETIATPAGHVAVKDGATSAPLREFVRRIAKPGDFVLDASYGGALSFADRWPSPIFSTQFSALAPSTKILARDLDLIERRPPKVVIANRGADFGASFGICLNTGCAFPRLVWRSTVLACRPSADFPVLDYIRSNYTPLATFGDKIVYGTK